jgi:dimethylargininase
LIHWSSRWNIKPLFVSPAAYFPFLSFGQVEEFMLIAITRQVSRSIDRCELTHLERTAIDLELAKRQHHAYEQTLRGLGMQVHSLPEEPLLPDSVFVEDTAVVLDECAIIARPGAVSRRPEVPSIAFALAPYRELISIQPPGTLDGGDVLVVEKTIYVGLSGRTNRAAADQLQSFVKSHGYMVKGVHLTGCLHLKSAVTLVSEKTLLINPAWVQEDNFPEMKFIEIDPSEPAAANALRLGENLLVQPVWPRTRAHLEAAGIHPLLVDQSELSKAEGGLTCCSLVFKGD